MAGNSRGKVFRLTTFGESHGKAIGGIVDGCPAGIELQEADIQCELDRRKPGQSVLTTARKESDTVSILSGVFEGKTTGTPIGFLIPNEDQRTKDYSEIKDAFRPSHADYTYETKYGIRDYRGGGRASARETANWVVGGAVANKVLQHYGIESSVYVSKVGAVSMMDTGAFFSKSEIDAQLVRCPDAATAEMMKELIEGVKAKGDTVGGQITGVVRNLPIGLGRPVFSKLNADLGQAFHGINAVKAVEFGIGTEATAYLGSELNDAFIIEDEAIRAHTNHSGGVQGGISNGAELTFRITFKPTATLMQKQNMVDKAGTAIELHPKGRHDPCVLPRAVPIVEAVCAMVIADHLLLQRTDKIDF